MDCEVKANLRSKVCEVRLGQRILQNLKNRRAQVGLRPSQEVSHEKVFK